MGRSYPPKPSKDLDHQQLIAPDWRPALSSIVTAIAAGDFGLSSSDPRVERPSAHDAERFAENIEAYGVVTIVDPPDATWETSVAMWMGTRWDAVVDLWAEEEGRTDLVLHVDIREHEASFRVEVHGIWVP